MIKKCNRLKLNIQFFADGEINYKVVLDNSGAIKSLEKLEDKGEKTSSTFKNLGSVGKAAFKGLAVGVTTAGTAMTALLGFGVKYNAEIEQLNTSFEVMTGSAEKAAEITERLKEMGASTPFETKDLAEVTQLLMNYGIEADTAIERMSMLGDISQGSADKMQRIAMAYGQMSSAGKVQLEDIKQMIEAGFNPLSEISQSTGESMASLYDRISDGTLSIEEITASMERSTSAGGKYFKSMEKQSKTLNGQISTLKDNFSSLAGTLANDVSGKLSTSILPEINQLIQDMESAFNEGGIPAMIEVMSNGITEMLVKLVEQLPQFIETGAQIIQSMINGISANKETLVNSIINAISELLYAGIDMLPQLLELGIEIILQLILGLAQKAPELVPEIVNAIIMMLQTFNEHFDDFLMAGAQLILGLIQGLINSIPTILENLPTILLAILNFFTASKMLSAGLALIKGLGNGLINGIPELLKNIPKIITSMINSLKSGVSSFSDIGKNLVQGLWNGIKSAKDWVLNKIKSFGNSILDGIKGIFGIHSPSKVLFEIGGYLDEGFINGVDSMKNDIEKQVDSTFGSGLDYLYNGYDNFNYSIPDTNYTDSFSQTILLENRNNNNTILSVDGKVLAETVNEYNENREVAV